MIEINLMHVDQLKRLFEQTQKQVPLVLVRAINRAASAARTQAARETRQIYNVKHGLVLGTIKISKANSGNLMADVRSRDENIPLLNFGARPTKRGVSVSVKRGSRKQLTDRTFIATLTNPKFQGGANNVFTRVSTKRYPLKGLYGPSIPQMIGNEEAMGKIQDRTSEILDKRIEHEINRLLGG